MFDDLEVNLTLPHERGMTTVWVTVGSVANGTDGTADATGAGGTSYHRMAAKRWRVWDLAAFLRSLTAAR